MSPLTPTSLTQLDDLLESLWNLEDIHRDLVQKVQRLVLQLEGRSLEDAGSSY